MKTKVRRYNRGAKSGSSFFAKSDDSHFFPAQTKLNVGEPGDRYEQEADKVADLVISGAENSVSNDIQTAPPTSNEELQEKSISENITPLIQRKEEHEEIMQMQPLEEEEEMLQTQLEEEEEELQLQPLEEEEEMLQTQEEEVQAQEEEELQAKGEAQVTPGVEKALQSNKGFGSKLDNNTRTEMEKSFGADFGQVNIHTGNDAVGMNKQLGAQAFTNGNNIFFNEGKYNPQSVDGKHLLAHELTHTIQQTGRIAPQLQLTIGDNHDLQSSRFSGDEVLEACMDGEQTLQFGSRGSAVRKMQSALVAAGFPLPIYGIDGIFEEETQGALQNFQRSSSLPATGILNAVTVSSLDVLFTYDQPVLPTGPASTTPPTISSDTINFAPNTGDTSRTDVGVGERVRFYGNTSGDWTASEGRIIGINNGENMVWEAPAVAATSIITLTTPAGSATINMSVIAPSTLTMTFDRNENIPVGTAGACMITEMLVHPLNVCFGRVQFAEIPGPASNVSGYFSGFPAANLAHTTAGHYVPFNDDNAGVADHAYYHALPSPFSNGTFGWVIPNRYKIDGESDAQGRFFTNTNQNFTITSTGALLITKAGTFVFRFINDTVIHGL